MGLIVVQFLFVLATIECGPASALKRQQVEMDRTPLMIALTVLILLNTSSVLARTYAFGPTCQYSSVVYSYPHQVAPSERFMLSISLPAVCPQTNNYHLTVRFDVDNNMNRVLASNYTQDGFVPNNGKPFTFTVTNELTAPSKPGPWQLQFIVYAFMSEDDADGLDYEVKALETIQVGQPIPLPASNNTMRSTIENSAIATRTTQSVASLSITETTLPTSSSNDLYRIVSVVTMVLLAVSLTLLVRRRGSS